MFLSGAGLCHAIVPWSVKAFGVHITDFSPIALGTFLILCMVHLPCSTIQVNSDLATTALSSITVCHDPRYFSGAVSREYVLNVQIICVLTWPCLCPTHLSLKSWAAESPYSQYQIPISTFLHPCHYCEFDDLVEWQWYNFQLGAVYYPLPPQRWIHLTATSTITLR